MSGDVHVRFCERQRGQFPLPTRLAGHPRGAGASATIYSLIETAKANGLEPYRYLRYLFERLPMAVTEENYRALLPQYVDRDFITNMKF